MSSLLQNIVGLMTFHPLAPFRNSNAAAKGLWSVLFLGLCLLAIFGKASPLGLLIVPGALFAIGSGMHLGAVKSKGSLATVLGLGSVLLQLVALALASLLAPAPWGYAYAASASVLGVLVHAWMFSRTLPFALVVFAPVAVVGLRGDAALLLIFLSGYLMALVVSGRFDATTELRAQNERLRSAVSVSHRVVTDSMDVALLNIMLGIGTFLHEIRNLQQCLGMNLKSLQENEPSDPDFAEAVQDALVQHKQIDALIKETLGKLKERRRPGRGSICVAEVLDAVRQKTGDRLSIDLTGAGAEFFVAGDRDQLYWAIEGLVRNSREAGAKTIKLRSVVDPSATGLTLEIEDDGPGLPPVVAAALFKPFGTFKPKGLGLGLYLTRRRIEAMGGTIQGENVPSGGALFRIRLPGHLASQPG